MKTIRRIRLQLLALLCFPLLANAQVPAQNESLAQICAEQYHGISYSAPAGAPVQVADDGVVASISQLTTFGRYALCDRYVVVFHQHANGKRAYTRYGGLGELAKQNGSTLKVGSTVKKGDSLGSIGRAGELVFEVRPFNDLTGQPNWSSIIQSDPGKFNFSNYQNSDNAPVPTTTWTRYQRQDLDTYLQGTLALFQPGQSGTKIFPRPEAIRTKVTLSASPFPCSGEGFRRMGAMLGLNIPNTINHCVRVTTAKGKVLRLFIQDAVASYLAREIGIGDSVELFIMHVFTNAPQDEKPESVFGMSINEFNVIP